MGLVEYLKYAVIGKVPPPAVPLKVAEVWVMLVALPVVTKRLEGAVGGGIMVQVGGLVALFKQEF